ncbi:hypothetical protein D3C71_1031720 [compost metagenome]
MIQSPLWIISANWDEFMDLGLATRPMVFSGPKKRPMNGLGGNNLDKSLWPGISDMLTSMAMDKLISRIKR